LSATSPTWCLVRWRLRRFEEKVSKTPQFHRFTGAFLNLRVLKATHLK
jgi:hypothetical protein